SGPPRPLVISESAPLRITMARSGDPASCIDALNPSAIDSTATRTTTTPAMPMMATMDDPSRCGMVRRLSTVTATICLSPPTSVPPQRIGDAQANGLCGRERTGQQAQDGHQPGAGHDVAGRQEEGRQQPVGGVAALHEEPRHPEPDGAAEQRDEQRFAEHDGK